MTKKELELVLKEKNIYSNQIIRYLDNNPILAFSIISVQLEKLSFEETITVVNLLLYEYLSKRMTVFEFFELETCLFEDLFRKR